MTGSWQIQPTKLTYWATKNIVPAICLIVLIEFAKFGIGFHIGKNAFVAFSANSLSMAVILIAASIFVSQNHYKGQTATAGNSKQLFNINFRGNLVLFTATFLLSIIAGNQWKRIENPALNADVFATLTEKSTNTINGDSLLNTLQQEQQLKNGKLFSKKQNTKSQEGKDDDLKRLGYLGLFILAMALSFLGLFLACSLACGSYGFLAALVFLLDLGIFGSGIYFLLKVFKKGNIKQWRTMDKAERKEEVKRYWKTVLISIGALAAFVLIANLLG